MTLFFKVSSWASFFCFVILMLLCTLHNFPCCTTFLDETSLPVLCLLCRLSSLSPYILHAKASINAYLLLPVTTLLNFGVFSTYFLPLFIYFLYLLFRSVPTAYGSSQGRGQIRDAATGLHHSTAMCDPSSVCHQHFSSPQCQILNPLSRAMFEPTSSYQP